MARSRGGSTATRWRGLDGWQRCDVLLTQGTFSSPSFVQNTGQVEEGWHVGGIAAARDGSRSEVTRDNGWLVLGWDQLTNQPHSVEIVVVSVEGEVGEVGAEQITDFFPRLRSSSHQLRL